MNGKVFSCSLPTTTATTTVYVCVSECVSESSINEQMRCRYGIAVSACGDHCVVYIVDTHIRNRIRILLWILLLLSFWWNWNWSCRATEIQANFHRVLHRWKIYRSIYINIRYRYRWNKFNKNIKCPDGHCSILRRHTDIVRWRYDSEWFDWGTGCGTGDESKIYRIQIKYRISRIYKYIFWGILIGHWSARQRSTEMKQKKRKSKRKKNTHELFISRSWLIMCVFMYMAQTRRAQLNVTAGNIWSFFKLSLPFERCFSLVAIVFVQIEIHIQCGVDDGLVENGCEEFQWNQFNVSKLFSENSYAINWRIDWLTGRGWINFETGNSAKERKNRRFCCAWSGVSSFISTMCFLLRSLSLFLLGIRSLFLCD